MFDFLTLPTDVSAPPGSTSSFPSAPVQHDIRSNTALRRRLEQDLRKAVAQEAFSLLYQPRARCRDGKYTGTEALIRWVHGRRGLVSPSYFIPMAEQNGLIVPIGAFVLRQACQEIVRWGRKDVVVSVNVSPRQLAGQALLAQVAQALEGSGLPAEQLELELTEQMLLNVDDDTLIGLSALRDLGVGLALDDFGTGFASLGMLRRLPLTAVKIDRSLVRELPNDPEDVAIVRAAIQTAQAMGLAVVAEGVETEEQHDFLAAIGCDEGQGYLYARPVPAERARAYFPA